MKQSDNFERVSAPDQNLYHQRVYRRGNIMHVPDYETPWHWREPGTNHLYTSGELIAAGAKADRYPLLKRDWLVNGL